ncbi:hypothetical protein KGO95_03840 [Patescibacteria group bacterium]|nr:hypothetical protein [Patescibacteria group bacterium]MDE2020359.1 hypothetical protein [Patescibacteria group bacterium]
MRKFLIGVLLFFLCGTASGQGWVFRDQPLNFLGVSAYDGPPVPESVGRTGWLVIHLATAPLPGHDFVLVKLCSTTFVVKVDPSQVFPGPPNASYEWGGSVSVSSAGHVIAQSEYPPYFVLSGKVVLVFRRYADLKRFPQFLDTQIRHYCASPSP